MMDLSIVIPVGRKENDFKLIKQIRGKFKNCEIIIVTDEANEFIKSEELDVDQTFSLRDSSRAKALNTGARLATRRNLWLLHLDSKVDHVQPSDLMLFDEFDVSTFLLEFDQANCWWIAAGTNFRTKVFGIPFGDQSFLLSKKLFDFIGKFDEDLLEGEDHEFIWRMKSLNIRLNVINKHIITSAKKYVSKRIYQTLKSLSKTFLQAMKFYRSRKSIVLATFIKYPRSPESKSRLRKGLDDEFVNTLNENLINITYGNLKRLRQRKKIHFIKVCRDVDEEKLNSYAEVHQGKFINQDQKLSRIMSELTELALKTIGKIALLGSDIPTLNVEDLNEALSKRLDKRSHFFSTEDGGFCFMISNDHDVVDCLSKVKSSTTSVMQTLTECLDRADVSKKIFTDVDVTLDLRRVYAQLRANKVNLSNEQKDLLYFLKANEGSFT